MDKYSELYAFLYRSAKKLISDFENMLLIVRDEKFPAELGEFVEKLQRLADHATHEIQDLTPIQEETEEFQITDELCDEAFREGLVAKDFSVAFLQRQFRLKYIDACNLQDKLRQRGNIKRTFLVGDTVCKGIKRETMDPRFIQQLECVPDTEGGEAAFVVLEQKVEKGAKRRFGCIGESEKNRLAHEFELIHATNTTKLFLYWADIVAAIRQKIYPYIYSVQNCSLVSYCLGITEVNPLLTGSYFERLLTRRSTHVPILFIEVPKGRGREASESLGGEVKSLIEIEENAALPDLDPIDVMDFFKRATFENRELLQSAAASLGLAGQKPLETVRALADLLVYKRYKEFMDEKPSLLYQEDAVDLLVKAGLSYEEAECARRAFAMKNRGETTSCRKMFERAARKNGYSIGEANAIFSAVEKEINFTVCRASYVAMAQYLYMDTFLQDKTKG